jgi:hypothetical protein
MDDEKMKIEKVIHNVRNHYVTMAMKQHNGFLVGPLNSVQVDMTNKDRKMTASVVLVHNDQLLALVVLVDDKNPHDRTDLQDHHAYCTDHNPLMVVVAFVVVHMVHHTDEILHPYNYYAYSDTIDRDRHRRRWNNHRFDPMTSLDNLDFEMIALTSNLTNDVENLHDVMDDLIFEIELLILQL